MFDKNNKYDTINYDIEKKRGKFMSNLKINSKKMKDLLKRGCSLALVLTTLGTLVGCGNNKQIIDDTTTSISTTVTNNILPTTPIINENKVETYDFKFNDHTVIQSNEFFGWDANISEVLKQQDENFEKLVSFDYGDGIVKSKQHYAIAMYTNKDKESYFRVVDFYGVYKNDKIYDYPEFINLDTVILVEKEYFDEITSNKKFEIMDLKSGHSSEFKAASVYTVSDYLVKSYYKVEGSIIMDVKFELLYSDGTKATNEIYEFITYDPIKNYIYLYNNGETEILDINTNKARKIKGRVVNSENGYLIKEEEELVPNDYGVFYLESLDSELKQEIPCMYEGIKILNNDEESTLFTVNKAGEKSYLVLKGNKVLPHAHDFYIKNGLTNFIYAYDMDEEKNTTITVYDIQGNLLSVTYQANHVDAIPETDKVLVKVNDTKRKIMDFEGNILVDTDFNGLEIYAVSADDGTIVDWYIMGIKDDVRYAYTKNLELVESGKYNYIEMINIINDHYDTLKENKQLTLTK